MPNQLDDITQTEVAVSIDQQPIYKMVGADRIPISKHLGPLWKSRNQQAMQKRKNQQLEETWNSNIREYRMSRNTQIGIYDRLSAGNKNENGLNTKTATENVVFSVVQTTVASLFSQMPKIEITPLCEKYTDQAQLIEKLLNAIINKTESPGINLAPKLKRALIITSLTNSAWLRIGYTQKQDSSDTALIELNNLALQLQEAKDREEILKIEGALQALELKINLLSPAGPSLHVVLPHDVLVDPECVQYDLSDAKWVMEREYINTHLLKAQFATENEDGEFISIFDPTHVIKLDEAATGDGDALFADNSSSEYKQYGYDDESVYKSAQVTCCWRVWDKVTRRVYLFNDADWKHPIWVWNDPYGLPRFFPLIPITYHLDPTERECKGEITYIMDQADSINEIASEQKIALQWTRRNVFYDPKMISAESVAAILTGPNGTAKPLTMLGDKKPEDALYSIPPPSVDFPNLFRSEPHYQSIARIIGMSPGQLGGEYRTNTTTTAANQYQAASMGRSASKQDAVEEAVSLALMQICYLCMNFMTQMEIAQLLGEQDDLTQVWQNMTPKQFDTMFGHLQLITGSMVKPTSPEKRKEALEVAQVLGQFASVGPAALIVALQVLKRAYDGVVVYPKEWQALIDSLMQQMQQPTDVDQAMSQIDQLPPQAREAIGLAVSKGVPVKEAITQITSQMKGNQNEPTR